MNERIHIQILTTELPKQLT